jgi:hypothetical protein
MRKRLIVAFLVALANIPLAYAGHALAACHEAYSEGTALWQPIRSR